MKRDISLVLALVLMLSLMPAGLFSITASAETTDTYTITYHLDGGTNALKNPDTYTSEDVITLKAASKEGYDFAGWFLNANETEPIFTIAGMGNLDIYAKFTPQTYTVTFDDNGATHSDTLTLMLDDISIPVKKGDVINPYSVYTPKKNGYVFLGWYNGAKLVTGSINIKSNLKLQSKWTVVSHKGNILGENISSVNWIYDGYGYVVSASGLNGDSYSSTKIMEDGYVYVYVSGYYETINYSGTGWCENNAYNGFQIYDVTNSKELVFVYPKDRDGHAVSGTTSESGTLTVAPGTLLRICSGRINYPHYSTGTVTLGTKRDADISSSDIRIVDIEFDSHINAPSVSKTGYKFLGWYDSKGNQMTDIWKYTKNQTFTAKWQPHDYGISYEVDGGTNSPSNPNTYTIEDTITLKDPTKPGYTFKGWYSDANFTTQVTSISNKTGNITLYAKWEVNTYNLTLDADNGAWAPKVTFISDGVEIKSCYLYGQDTITAYHPAGKDGYIFAGWYKNDTFTSLYKFNGTITNDITLYAKWVECDNNNINIESTENINAAIQGKTEQLYAFVPLVDGKITITSESNNLDLYGALYDASKNILTYADDISGADLDFTYTYNVKAGQLYYIAVKGNTASTVGQAVVNIGWTGNCTITGTTYQNRQLTVVYDTNFKLPQKPVREGYVFLGWFDENDTQITDGTWNFVIDKTLTAKWEEATYHTVVFKDIDGNVISSETYYLSEDVVAPALPIKVPDNTYIYHAKWDNDYTGVCTGDAVYSPVFDAEYIEYTVVFADEDGTELSRGTYHWGDVVTVPAAPAKAPDASYANIYTFAGWDNSVVNCAGDATYTATYTTVPLKQLVITSQPEKLRYCTGERLDLTGLALQLVYENGTIISLDSVDAQFVSANTLTAGRKTATITIAGIFTEFEIYVHNVKDSIVNVDSSVYPQSSHDYSNNLDETKTFTYPGAESLVITFNSQTSVENNYDYIYIYDGAGNQIAKYTGTTAANKTLTISGDTFKVRITSDYSNVKYGYAFSSIQANMVNGGEIIHRPVTDPATVTCTQSGLTEGSYCEICGDILVAQEEVAALGHQYKTIFTWSEDHTSCAVTITCERGCGLNEVVDCIVTHSEPHKAQTVHTAVAELDGESFTDILTCDNFLIVFKDWDGTQISSTYYHAGDVVTIPSDPNRLADNTYTYTFAGWDQTVVNCAGNATYTATYISNYIDYTVVFKNWNGDVLSTQTYHYGDKVTAPTTPIKPTDNTYTYTFAGWDAAVVDCAGDATYTATYTSDYIDYTVVFKNWNGEVISSTTYHWGDAVTGPATPTKPADNTYTYAFAGWDKPVVNCAGNATYTALYTAAYRNYTITFKNWDGTVLSSKTYHYGDKVTAPSNPTRDTDNTYSYAFAGWDKEVVNCAGDATYTATYAPSYIDYTVVFKNWDGTILSTKTYHYGDAVTAPANPTRVADDTYTYAFTGWDKDVVNCAGNVTYTAQYTANYINYTVVFKNWDGTVLSTKTYHYGDKVTVPSNPTRAEDNTYTYTFKGWDKEVVNCEGNAIYTATYKSTCRDYVVIFQDWDGTVLSTNTFCWGDTVTIPSNPTRTADNTYSYTFKGWDKEVVICAGDVTYTAQYTAVYKNYTIIFKDWDGTVLSTKTYHYGDAVTAPSTPAKAADSTYTYTFKGWDKAVVNCAGDTTYTATYTPSYINYTVVFKNWDGTVLSSKTYHYGDKVTAPANPTKAADNTYTYTFIGWDRAVVDCAGDAIYTATYSSKYIDYTVVFKNWNGTVLSTKTYHYGDTVAAPSAPTRPNDSQYSYTFTGWDKTVANCTGNATYTAVYSAKSLVPNTITSSKYTVSNGTISKISVGTTTETLLGNLGEGRYAKVYQGNKEVAKNALIGTGMTVKIMDGNTTKASATVVVTGDTNGDGKVTVTDMLAAKAHLLKKNTLSGASGQAADTNGDGSISITDFIQMKAHVLGKSQVEPKSTVAVVQTSVVSIEPETENTPTAEQAMVVTVDLRYTQPDAVLPEKRILVNV